MLLDCTWVSSASEHLRHNGFQVASELRDFYVGALCLNIKICSTLTRTTELLQKTFFQKNDKYYSTCTNFVSLESICINISSHASHMHVNDNFIYYNTDTDISVIPFPPLKTCARTGCYNTKGRYTVDII